MCGPYCHHNRRHQQAAGSLIHSNLKPAGFHLTLPGSFNTTSGHHISTPHPPLDTLCIYEIAIFFGTSSLRFPSVKGRGAADARLRLPPRNVSGNEEGGVVQQKRDRIRASVWSFSPESKLDRYI